MNQQPIAVAPIASAMSDGPVTVDGGPRSELELVEPEPPIPDEPSERRPEIPLPQDIQSVVLICILALMIFYTLYFAGQVIRPILFAFVLHLVLQPAMRGFGRIGLPRPVAALVIISLFFGILGAFAFAIADPAAEWIAKAPDSLAELESRLWLLKRPIALLIDASKQLETLATGGSDPAITVRGPSLGSFLFTGTLSFLTALGTTILLLFFLLAAGDVFLRRLVEILPRLSNKKRAVEISREIEQNVSAYLGTVTLINAGVGVATGIAMWFCGLSDPVLWGVVAFLLNFVIIVGPLACLGILLLVGLLSFPTFLQGLVPAGVYLAIHLIEGEILTPMVLARRFVLNPVLVILSLVFWFWMWGVAGALLAVPMLAIAKIVFDRIEPLMALGHFLGGEPRTQPGNGSG
ncbi:MAG: AI-2E family transporter [Alphaproteobacteria bacterium]